MSGQVKQALVIFSISHLNFELFLLIKLQWCLKNFDVDGFLVLFASMQHVLSVLIHDLMLG